MSVASQIMAYFDQHGKATRPQLQRELDLHEKAVESAMRKLVSKRFVRETGERVKLPGHRMALVYEKGEESFSQTLFSHGPTPVGRPKRSVSPESAASFDALSLAMNALFAREAA
jgi:hypothetical protein